MPTNYQIIPEYLQPHTMTIINDNTEFQEVVATVEPAARSIFVITSGKGRDNVLLQKDDETAFINEFGKPNYDQFGQAGYNAYAALKTRALRGYVMRVMPTDATYANLAIVAKVKTDATTPGNKKLIVRYEASFIPAVDNVDDFSALLEGLVDEDPDTDGFVTLPIGIFYMQGRGVYGNSFRIRLTSAVSADKDNDFKNYRVEVYELDGALKSQEVFEGTLLIDSVVGSQSEYITDKISDSDNGSQRIGAYFHYPSFSKVVELYKAAQPTVNVDINTVDIFTGKTKAGTALTNFTLDTGHADWVSFDDPQGVTLSGGSDGTLTYNPADPASLASRTLIINDLYGKAWRGELDPAIKSKRRTPADFILDANYEASVKNDVIQTVTKRLDAYGYIDGGLLTSLTDAIAWGEEMATLGDINFSKDFQHYKIRDPFTGKPIPVTVTYLFAQRLPLHFKNFGKHIPFTGTDYAQITGHIKNSIKPLVDADDVENKEKLYNLRLNYFQSIDESTVVRGTQSTSQPKWSDLSEENNVLVLLDIKRKLEVMVSGLAYDFSDAEERRRFTQAADRIIAPYRGVQIATGEVGFSQNQFETTRSILHCFLAITYRGMAKRGIIEIDINPRQAS